jgi:hypothetical protein
LTCTQQDSPLAKCTFQHSGHQPGRHAVCHELGWALSFQLTPTRVAKKQRQWCHATRMQLGRYEPESVASWTNVTLSSWSSVVPCTACAMHGAWVSSGTAGHPGLFTGIRLHCESLPPPCLAGVGHQPCVAGWQPPHGAITKCTRPAQCSYRGPNTRVGMRAPTPKHTSAFGARFVGLPPAGDGLQAIY